VRSPNRYAAAGTVDEALSSPSHFGHIGIRTFQALLSSLEEKNVVSTCVSFEPHCGQLI
jgi:hypothetical protein